MNVERPWGEFCLITQNEKSTVKLITVKKGERTSLQSHTQRDELWFIVKGRFKVTIGIESVIAGDGREFSVPKGMKHRLEGIDDVNTLLEVSMGHFSEDDIKRYADDYGRS